MVDLELLDNTILSVESGSEGNQSEEEYSSAKHMRDPPRIDGIPKEEPSAIKDWSSNIDKDICESHHCKINQADAILILSLVDTSKEEGVADRKIQLHADPDNGVTKSSTEYLRKTECSHNASKILKTTE